MSDSGITTDEIKIVIRGESGSASRSINNTISKLEHLKTAISGFSSSSGLETALASIGEGLKEINSVRVNEVKNLVNALTRADAGNISKVAASMTELSDSMRSFDSISESKLRAIADIMQASRIKSAGKNVSNAITEAGKSAGEYQTGGKSTAETEEATQAKYTVPKFDRSLSDPYKAQVVTESQNATLRTHVSLLHKAGDALKRWVANSHGARRSTDGLAARIRSLGQDVMRILKYRMIRSAIRLVTSSFTEGIKNAYQYAVQTGNQFQQTMDNLATSALYVKNSMGAMAMPLLNQLAPAIDYVADKFVQLLNLINHFFAVISGASTWTRALKYPVKFNNGVASSANGAKKAADELKATILGLDELNLLNDQKDPKSGSGGGGGAAANDYGAMFETVDVGTSALANTLKDLFKPFKLAWENEGQATLDSIEYAFDSIKGLIGTIAKDFKDMWTGGAGQEIIEKILRTWQNINIAIGNVANNIKLAWEENGRGQKIVEGIFGIFNDLAGTVERISDSTRRWAGTLDFGPLLDSVGGLVQSFRDFIGVLSPKFEWLWNNILLPFGKWTIETALPKTIDALSAAFEAVGKAIDSVWPVLEPILIFLRDTAFRSFEKFVDAITNFADAISSLCDLDIEGTFSSLSEGFKNLATNPLVLALLAKGSLSGLFTGGGASGVASAGAGATTGGGLLSGLLVGFGPLIQSAMIGGTVDSTSEKLKEALSNPKSSPDLLPYSTIDVDVRGANASSSELLDWLSGKKPKKNVTVNGKGTEDDVLKSIRKIFGFDKKTIELGYKTDNSRNTWNVKEWFDTKTRSFFNWLGYKSDGTEKTSVFTTWKNLAGRVIKNILGYNADGTERTNWFRQWLTVAGRTIKNWLGYNMDGSENSSDTKTWLGAKAKTARATLGYTMDGSQNNSNVTTWRNTSSSRSTFWKTLGFKTDGSESNKNVLKWLNTESSTISKTLQMNLKLKVEAIAAGKSASSGNTPAVSILDQRLLFAQGGFPASGSVFVANENGPEYVGKFGSGTAVANNDQIVEGISAGVANANSEQNRLLREQNELLRAILEKDNGGSSVSASDVLRALSQTNRRTGHPVVAMN